MKNAHFLVWFGLGGVLSYAIGQFINGTDTKINFYIWMLFLIAGGVISTTQLKKKKE
jgi:hypothetical protein